MEEVPAQLGFPHLLALGYCSLLLLDVSAQTSLYVIIRKHYLLALNKWKLNYSQRQ